MPTAIVAGASSILGYAIVAALGKDSRWTKIHALAWSENAECPPTIQHHHLDLTGSVENISKELQSQEIVGDYIFFAADLANDGIPETIEASSTILQNFLRAFEINGVETNLKRIVFATGAKQHGIHQNAVKYSVGKTDLQIEGLPCAPNSHYTHQQILHEYAKRGGYSWTVTYTSDLIGVARGNFMNMSTSLAIYAAINAELDGQLEFPGSGKFYNMFYCFTSAKLHADFAIWAAKNPRCANEAFNVVNGDVQTWANMWPKLAHKFGCRVPPKQFERRSSYSDESSESTEDPIELAELEEEIEQWEAVQRIDLVEWSQKQEVQDAWANMAGREGLEKDALRKATWGFPGFVPGKEYISMSKARKAGWIGYVDTWDALSETFDDLMKEKIVPRYQEATH